MNRKKNLTKKQKEIIKSKFKEYKDNSNITLYTIAKELNLDATTIGNYFKRYFGEEYRKISELKSAKHSEVIKEEQIIDSFEEYKKGIPLKEIAKKLNLNSASLYQRIFRKFGKKFQEIAKERRLIDAGKSRQKVSDEKLKEAFEIYQNNRKSLTSIAEDLEIKESSLISRFKKLFGKKYINIAISRRDERKVKKEDYIKAFDKYKNTDASLIDLSKELDIRIGSLRPRFINLFGNEYIKIALQKQDAEELNRKGKEAEKIALDYLKKVGITINDVRGKAILKNTLKRPDFIFKDMFIEIKSYYINLDRKRIKGYNQIISDYLNKELKDGSILRKGMIISLKGFSDEVKEKAKKDDISLIGPDELFSF